jgi:aspartate 1-decarboxylase
MNNNFLFHKKFRILQKKMFIEILKSKIHRVFVTEVNINYQGSITIDEDLMDAANLVEHEKVQVLNYNNGERIDTYVIKGKRGTGEICMNGPAARKFLVGDPIIVISYAMVDAQEAKNLIPKIIFVDNDNKMISK